MPDVELNPKDEFWVDPDSLTPQLTWIREIRTRQNKRDPRWGFGAIPRQPRAPDYDTLRQPEVRSAINQRHKLESQGQGVALLGTPRMQHLWRYITDPRSICDVLLFPLLRPNATEPHR
jgi:hypothetical protein